MHKLDIIIDYELQYVEFSDNFGKARKRKNEIVRNGFELVHADKQVATHYPPHRIQRVDVYPVQEPTQQEETPEDD